MHLSYYFLRFVAEELRDKLLGFSLKECYLQNRYECILAFQKEGSEFFIKLNLYPGFTCLAFPEEFFKSKKGTYNLFNTLNGLKVIGIQMHENDRSFHLVFENELSLMFKLYGSRSNLLLFNKNSCIDLWNKNLEVDSEVQLDKMGKKISQDFETFVKESGSLKSIFPTFDQTIMEELERYQYNEQSLEGKWEIIQQLLDKFIKKTFRIQEFANKVELSFFDRGKLLNSTDSAIEASNLYERWAGQVFYLNYEKETIIQLLLQKIKKATNYLQVVHQKLIEISGQTRYEEIANIIMANLHQIPKHVDRVELFNFYTESTIQIKLKKDLTPQKNAENYYRKAKNQKLEIGELEKNVHAKEVELKLLQHHLSILKEFENLKELRNYLKENKLEISVKDKERGQDDLFRKFEIEGFEVFVGKSARNNDLLTQKYSFKEDLWLHARDVAGSHVLIKYKAGKSFPKTVIEKAAQLAAYYSKRKTDSLCPVIVTPKKFVRKPKGALEGQVIVEKEQVVLVKPASFDELARIL